MSEFNQKVREGRGGLQEVFFYCGWSAMEMARRRWALRGWLRWPRRPLRMQRLCSAPGQGRRHFRLVALAPMSGAPVGCAGWAGRRSCHPGLGLGLPFVLDVSGDWTSSSNGAPSVSSQALKSLRKKLPLFPWFGVDIGGTLVKRLYLEPKDITAEEEEVESPKSIGKYLTSSVSYGSTGIRDVHLELKDLTPSFSKGRKGNLHFTWLPTHNIPAFIQLGGDKNVWNLHTCLLSLG